MPHSAALRSSLGARARERVAQDARAGQPLACEPRACVTDRGNGDSPAKCRTEHRPIQSNVLDPSDPRRRHQLATEDVELGVLLASTTAPRSSSSPPSARWPTPWVPARSCWRSAGLRRQHGQAFGSYGAWKGLGYTLGPLLGGVLVTLGGFRCCSGCWPDWAWPWPAGQPPPCRPPYPCRAPGRPSSGWPGGWVNPRSCAQSLRWPAPPPRSAPPWGSCRSEVLPRAWAARHRRRRLPAAPDRRAHPASGRPRRRRRPPAPSQPVWPSGLPWRPPGSVPSRSPGLAGLLAAIAIGVGVGLVTPLGFATLPRRISWAAGPDHGRRRGRPRTRRRRRTHAGGRPGQHRRARRRAAGAGGRPTSSLAMRPPDNRRPEPYQLQTLRHRQQPDLRRSSGRRCRQPGAGPGACHPRLVRGRSIISFNYFLLGDGGRPGGSCPAAMCRCSPTPGAGHAATAAAAPRGMKGWLLPVTGLALAAIAHALAAAVGPAVGTIGAGT